MSTMNRRIQMGNAAEVTEMGIDVQIIPEEGGGGYVGANESFVIRYSGLDVANGSEWPNPDNLAVDDPSFAGWAMLKWYPYIDYTGPRVEVINNLPDTWTDAFLVVTISAATITGDPDDEMLMFEFEVTGASIERELREVDRITYQFNTGTNMMDIVDGSGVYVLQLAATASDGKKRMTSCLVGPSMWTTMKAYDDAQSDSINPFDSYLYNFDQAVSFLPFPILPIYGITAEANVGRDPFRGLDSLSAFFAFEVEQVA